MVRAERLHAHGDGPVHADCVGHLDLAAVRVAGGDDVLRRVARVVGGAAVNLRGILSGEGTAAVSGHAAVGVHDDLAPGEAAVARGAAHHELAGGVHVEARAVREELRLREAVAGDLLDLRIEFLVRAVLSGLVRNDYRVDCDGASVFVDDGKLALGVGA